MTEEDADELVLLDFLRSFAGLPYDPVMAVYDSGFRTHTVRSWRQGLTDCRQPFYDRMEGLNLYSLLDDEHISMSPVGLPDILPTLCSACVDSYIDFGGNDVA